MNELATEYLSKAEGHMHDAVELMARDLARGDKATFKAGYPARSAVQAAMQAFYPDCIMDLPDKVAMIGRVEAWLEGREEPDPRTCDEVLAAKVESEGAYKLVQFSLTSYEKSVLEGALHYGVQEFAIIGYDSDADTCGELLERLADQVPQDDDEWSVKLPEGSKAS